MQFAFGPREASQRLKAFWTNIGLVSALLIGVTYSQAITPVQVKSLDQR